MQKLMLTVGLAAVLCLSGQLVCGQDAAEPVPIISFKDYVNPDGTYEFGYEAGNGIKVDANGDGERQTGNVKYIDPDGNPVEWSYTADVNGYQPQGASIPAIPEYVARALQYIRDHSTPAPATADAS